MRIHNFRAGFATNSSSSHSVVLLPPDQIGSVRSLDTHNDDQYHWEFFRLAETEEKLRYLAAQFFMSYGGDSEAMAEIIDMIEAEVPGYKAQYGEAMVNHDPDDYRSDLPSVDHQSVLGLPRPYNRELADGLIKFFKSPRVVVLGGNDNSDGNDHIKPVGAEEVEFLESLRDSAGGNYLTRRDGPFWTLFDRRNGTKLRFSFDRDDLAVTDYTKSNAPELVDVKITDWCDRGCAFCLEAGTGISTPTGTTPIEEIAVGDEVMVLDFATGKRQSERVSETYRRPYQGVILDVEMDDGKVISITPNHEVFVTTKGWIAADELEEGDEVVDFREIG